MQTQKNLVAIIGASSGIGASTAKLFSSQGYPLLLLARRIDKMKEINLPNALCLQCDITDAKQIEDCIQQGEKLYGAIDCLINSAGTAAGSPDPSTQDLAEQYKMIDINCKGMLNAIHAVLPGMKERKAGTIINIGSLTGKKTFPGVSVYCASKFFVHAVTENMREEMAAFNVRFVVVAPGPTQTDMLPEALKAFEPLLPLIFQNLFIQNQIIYHQILNFNYPKVAGLYYQISEI